MTPTKQGKTTHIKIERKKRQQTDNPDIVHVAGGQHQGLVIAKNDAGISSHTCCDYLLTVVFSVLLSLTLF